MPKLIICQGIPASGKTTWSRNFIKDNDNWIRINRDDIRRMFGTYWVPSRERLVEAAEYAIAEQAAKKNYNIVIDDSNLNIKYIRNWTDFARSFNYDIEFKKFNISLEEAIERDKSREFPVGEETIRNFYNKYENL